VSPSSSSSLAANNWSGGSGLVDEAVTAVVLATCSGSPGEVGVPWCAGGVLADRPGDTTGAVRSNAVRCGGGANGSIIGRQDEADTIREWHP
jgi:hypothetical protein